MDTMTPEEIKAVVGRLRPAEKGVLLERLIQELQEIQPELVYLWIAEIIQRRERD